MRRPETITRTIGIAEVKDQRSPLANEVSRKEIPVIVEESRAPIAALVSLDDLERLARLDEERKVRFTVVDRMRAAFRCSGCSD
jgi:PHD/YefM family antitoxin component YafN of YafNO toxin-antitoxin module